MLFISYDFMQGILLKNKTDEVLKNLVVSHNGEGGHKNRVRRLKSNEERKVLLNTNRVSDTCDVIFSYEENGENKSIVVYDKLSAESLTLSIIIEVTKVDGVYNINTIVN